MVDPQLRDGLRGGSTGPPDVSHTEQAEYVRVDTVAVRDEVARLDVVPLGVEPVGDAGELGSGLGGAGRATASATVGSGSTATFDGAGVAGGFLGYLDRTNANGAGSRRRRNYVTSNTTNGLDNLTG
jgi:hypothetical protein